MSEPVSRQQASRDQPPLSDFTLIVRPPDRPGDIRVFTDARRSDAELYAAAAGAVVEAMPLEYPDGRR